MDALEGEHAPVADTESPRLVRQRLAPTGRRALAARRAISERPVSAVVGAPGWEYDDHALLVTRSRPGVRPRLQQASAARNVTATAPSPRTRRSPSHSDGMIITFTNECPVTGSGAPRCCPWIRVGRRRCAWMYPFSSPSGWSVRRRPVGFGIPPILRSPEYLRRKRRGRMGHRCRRRGLPIRSSSGGRRWSWSDVAARSPM
jgi:hypothetical protein